MHQTVLEHTDQVIFSTQQECKWGLDLIKIPAIQHTQGNLLLLS